MKVYVDGIGLVGPGFAGWDASRTVLAGQSPWLDAPAAIPASTLLPPAERRRTGVPVKLALAAGSEAVAHAQRDAATLPTVFASSGGDGDNMHAIFEMLASNGREVSPTRFHNSVHNAPSGYWSIATKSMASSTSIACYDDSFAAGLVETATQVLTSEEVSVLIAYDAPYPSPINEIRTIRAPFGVALVLVRTRSERSLAALDIRIGRASQPDTTSADPALEALRTGIPAARSLPLLAALAGNGSEVRIGYVAGNQLSIAVQPC